MTELAAREHLGPAGCDLLDGGGPGHVEAQLGAALERLVGAREAPQLNIGEQPAVASGRHHRVGVDAALEDEVLRHLEDRRVLEAALGQGVAEVQDAPLELEPALGREVHPVEPQMWKCSALIAFGSQRGVHGDEVVELVDDETDAERADHQRHDEPRGGAAAGEGGHQLGARTERREREAGGDEHGGGRDQHGHLGEAVAVEPQHPEEPAGARVVAGPIGEVDDAVEHAETPSSTARNERRKRRAR